MLLQSCFITSHPYNSEDYQIENKAANVMNVWYLKNKKNFLKIGNFNYSSAFRVPVDTKEGISSDFADNNFDS